MNDGRFFVWSAGHAIARTTESFPLAVANEALTRLRSGHLTGAAVPDYR